MAQAVAEAAKAEQARAAARAAQSQRAKEQAVVTRNQPDRGLQQAQAQVAEAQRVADIVTRASTVPVDRGLKKAEENRKAQQAAQAAALNQQAALAAAAHQAQVAKAQAELAAFKNSREYQDFNASIPAHLIDMATQVDTFSDIAYGGHQGRHGEGWGGESTASRGGRGGAF
jgi:nitrate reductase alpha subunit